VKNFKKEAMADLKAGAAKGGAAARGEKKRRAMKGVKPGVKSAGRANAALNGKGWRHGEVNRVGFKVHGPDAFSDVGRACQEWLRQHGVPCGGFREVMMNEMRNQTEKKHEN